MAKTHYTSDNSKTKIMDSSRAGPSTVSRDDKKIINKYPIDLKLWIQLQPREQKYKIRSQKMKEKNICFYGDCPPKKKFNFF